MRMSLFAAPLLAAVLCSCAPKPAAPPAGEVDDNDADFMHVNYQPLSPDFRDNWFVARGDWSLTERALSGAGDAQADLNGPFYSPMVFLCLLSATPNSRPRIAFGDAFELAGDPAPDGDGMLLTLRPLSGGGSPSRAARVDYGEPRSIKVLVKELEVGLFVDGKEAARLDSGADSVEVIKFTAGDLDHPGKASFGGILIAQ